MVQSLLLKLMVDLVRDDVRTPAPRGDAHSVPHGGPYTIHLWWSVGNADVGVGRQNAAVRHGDERSLSTARDPAVKAAVRYRAIFTASRNSGHFTKSTAFEAMLAFRPSFILKPKKSLNGPVSRVLPVLSLRCAYRSVQSLSVRLGSRSDEPY